MTSRVLSDLNRDTIALSASSHGGTAVAAGGFGHITSDERRSLFRLKEERVPVAWIAARLGRHGLTIYRELGRNQVRDPGHAGDRWRHVSGHYPVTVHDQASARRRLARLARHKDLLACIVDRLRPG